MNHQYHPQTSATSIGIAADKEHRAIAPPLYLSANFGWVSPDEKPKFDYARSGNPTRSQLEQTLSELEGAAGCTVTSSGMAAIHLVLCLLHSNDTIIAPHDCYGGTYRLLRAYADKGHFTVKFIDQTDPVALQTALTAGAKILFIETPSNPLLRITDIGLCVRLAKKVGTLVVADNTFLSPALQQPLKLGCDVVVHSTTKFINGHSDVVGGAVLAKNLDLAEELAWWANTTGVTGAAFDSYQTLRGLRTLFARISIQQTNTRKIVDVLHKLPEVNRILYPGLPTHLGHQIAAQQQSGFGSMFSVEFSKEVNVKDTLLKLQIFTIAESLGGFESLVCVPASMTHASMSKKARETAGISERLVRFSIGLEHVDDLIDDLLAALGVAE